MSEEGEGYWWTAQDCNDDDPNINPLAHEIWYDGVDQDCDGNDGDADGDGYDSEAVGRSEEHTSELQSQAYLVCRLLLEKKKTR